MVPLLKDAGADVNAKYGDGSTLLHCAAMNGVASAAAAAVEALLAAGADANAREADEETPLHWAADNNSNAEAAAAAISALAAAPGVDVGAVNKRGRTPLHVAATNDDPAAAAAAARALLAAGADPRICDSDGVPPLVAAMQRKDAGACGELLQVLAQADQGSGSAGAGPSNGGGAGPSGSGSVANPSRLLHLAAAGVRQLLKRKAPEEQAECVVCWDAPRSHAVVPCFHLALCEGCAEQLCTKRRSQCPVCRDPAKGSQRIFLS